MNPELPHQQEERSSESITCRSNIALELLSTQERESKQLTMLNDLLRHAQKSPFYKETIGSVQLTSLDEMSDKIPLLTREMLTRHGGPDDLSMETEGRKGGWTFRSTGSGGKPFFSIRTKEDVEVHMSRNARFMNHVVNQNDTIFNCLLMGGGWSGGIGAHDFLGHTKATSIPLGSLLEKEELIEFWHVLKPNTIIAMPSVLMRIANDMANQSDLSKIHKIFFMGEQFWPDQREFVKSIVGGAKIEIFGHFANTECGAIGMQICDKTPDNVYHVIPDANIIEIIDPDTHKPVPIGTTGQIVITTFNRLHKPIIRLLTDDLGRLRPQCDCGLNTQMLEVLGRSATELIKVGRTQISLNTFMNQIIKETQAMGIHVLARQIRLSRIQAKTQILVLLESNAGKDMHIDENLLASFLSNSSAEMGNVPIEEIRTTTSIQARFIEPNTIQRVGTANKIPFLVDERK